MKCPFLKITKHEPPNKWSAGEDKEYFGDCYRYDCPFYYMVTNEKEGETYERCERTKSERL